MGLIMAGMLFESSRVYVSIHMGSNVVCVLEISRYFQPITAGQCSMSEANYLDNGMSVLIRDVLVQKFCYV